MHRSTHARCCRIHRNDLRLTGTHVGCDTGSAVPHRALSTASPSKSCTSGGASQCSTIGTIEGLAAANGELHPMQAGVKDCHDCMRLLHARPWS